ncbi:hypothetical protein C8F04DRAFT_642872, partial [Mycena alexandri]
SSSHHLLTSSARVPRCQAKSSVFNRHIRPSDTSTAPYKSSQSKINESTANYSFHQQGRMQDARGVSNYASQWSNDGVGCADANKACLRYDVGACELRSAISGAYPARSRRAGDVDVCVLLPLFPTCSFPSARTGAFGHTLHEPMTDLVALVARLVALMARLVDARRNHVDTVATVDVSSSPFRAATPRVRGTSGVHPTRKGRHVRIASQIPACASAPFFARSDRARGCSGATRQCDSAIRRVNHLRYGVMGDSLVVVGNDADASFARWGLRAGVPF